MKPPPCRVPSDQQKMISMLEMQIQHPGFVCNGRLLLDGSAFGVHFFALVNSFFVLILSTSHGCSAIFSPSVYGVCICKRILCMCVCECECV